MSEYFYRKNPSAGEWHFIINEVKYVEQQMSKQELIYPDASGVWIDGEWHPDKYNFRDTILMLARYYRGYLGLSKCESEQKIYDYISTLCNNIDGNDLKTIPWLNFIEKATSKRRGKGCVGYQTVRDFDSVGVTQREIDIINALENEQEKYIAFTLLVFARLSNKFAVCNGRKPIGFVYPAVSVIRRCAGLKKGNNDRVLAIERDLVKKGLFKWFDRYDKYTGMGNRDFHYAILQCRFTDVEGEEIYQIYNIDRLDLTWRKINGDKHIGICEVCGKYFEKGSNKQKYCKKCAAEKEKKRNHNKRKDVA